MGVAPMATPGTDERLDARARRVDWFIDRAAPYVGLLIGTATAPLALPPSQAEWIAVGALVAGAAGWSLWLATLPPIRARRPGWDLLYMGGLLAFMAALTALSPFFAFMAFGAYVQASYLKGAWRWTAVGATAAIVAYAQLGGRFAEFGWGWLLAYLALVAINGGLVGGLTYLTVLTAQQSEGRKRTIVELAEANRKLADTMEENAGLHEQLLAQAREAGVLDERQRLAREIHDTLAQSLTGIVAQLEAADAADGEPAARRRHVHTARDLAREGLSEARRSVQALGPASLEHAHLPAALAELAERWAQTAKVELSVETTGQPRPLLADLEVTLFRVAQEALANVGKHAQAGKVGITLSYMDDVVVLDVCDDGVGFAASGDSANGSGTGFGLRAMRQRVQVVAGRLDVESTPGEGTAVSASVPAIMTTAPR